MIAVAIPVVKYTTNCGKTFGDQVAEHNAKARGTGDPGASMYSLSAFSLCVRAYHPQKPR